MFFWTQCVTVNARMLCDAIACRVLSQWKAAAASVSYQFLCLSSRIISNRSHKSFSNSLYIVCQKWIIGS